MPLSFIKTRPQVRTAKDEQVPSQAEIERQIAKLKEDSARDVERQLGQQRVAAKEAKIREDVKKVAEDVEEEVETIFKDAEADVEGVKGSRGLRALRERVKSTEKGTPRKRSGRN